jgi:uncharacterized paraquat-inducible protein A
MAMHLFSTPVECHNCGEVVDDPRVDKCPKCGALLQERRTPSRLAGVEKRYGNLRVILGSLRFLGVIVALVGILLFFFGIGEEGMAWTTNLLIMLATLLLAAAAFSVSSFFEVALDIEENTRASFKVQRLILEQLGASDQPARK